MVDEPRESGEAAPRGLVLRTPLRVVVLLFLASLALRLIVAWPMLSATTWPVWDEAGYLERAAAFTRIFESLVAGELEQSDLDVAYGRGVWPPLAPFVFALGLLVTGGAAVGARLINALIAAATTPLVFALTRQAGGRPAALAAALCHLLYPGFVGFATLLWSETIFVFFLLAAVSRFLAAAASGAAPSEATRGALLGGVLVGLATLTRAAGLPFVAALPAWLAYAAPRGRRLRLSALALVAALLPLLPWQGVLAAREGRFVAVSTSNGMNLLLGQFPAAEGESGTERKVRVHGAARSHARERGLSLAEAAEELARAEIRRDPPAFLLRSLSRFGEIWDADRHLARHLFQAVVPPTSPRLALAVWLTLALSFAGLTGLALWGLFTGVPRRGLWLLLVAIGTLPPLFTVASPRMALPLLALLLPAAGFGWANSFAARRPRGALAAGFLVLLLSWWHGWQFRASSSFYGPAQNAWRWLADAEAERRSPGRVSDQLAFRLRTEGCSEVRISPAAGAAFAAGAEDRVLSAAAPFQLLTLVNLDPGLRPPRLTVSCTAPAAEHELLPITRQGWQRWRSCGVEGCEVYWLGGGEVAPTPFDGPPGASLRNGSSDAL